MSKNGTNAMIVTPAALAEERRATNQLRQDLTRARDELERMREQLAIAGEKVNELRELVSLHRDACDKTKAQLDAATRQALDLHDQLAMERANNPAEYQIDKLVQLRAGGLADGKEETLIFHTFTAPRAEVIGAGIELLRDRTHPEYIAWREANAMIAELKLQLANVKQDPGLIRDLSMTVTRLARRLHMAEPESMLPGLAIDFLQRHDLIGSPLRGGAEEVNQAHRDSEADAAAQLASAIATLALVRDPVTAAHYAMSQLTVEGMADFLDDHREVWAVLAGEMEHIELKQATTWPARAVRMTFTHPTIGDDRLTPLLVSTLHMLATHMKQADDQHSQLEGVISYDSGLFVNIEDFPMTTQEDAQQIHAEAMRGQAAGSWTVNIAQDGRIEGLSMRMPGVGIDAVHRSHADAIATGAGILLASTEGLERVDPYTVLLHPDPAVEWNKALRGENQAGIVDTEGKPIVYDLSLQGFTKGEATTEAPPEIVTIATEGQEQAADVLTVQYEGPERRGVHIPGAIWPDPAKSKFSLKDDNSPMNPGNRHAPLKRRHDD